MRLKPLPEPPDELETVRTAQRAVPLVPGSEDDCCARIMNRLDLAERAEARTWLTFLRAIGLAEEGTSGFRRVRREPTPDYLADAFLEGVFGASETLSALDESDPRDAAAVFERTEGIVPRWERRKHPETWRSVWQDRTGDLLGWFDLLGLAEGGETGFVRA